MIWFTADHHFGHANVIEYTERPYKSVEEMDADLIARWNDAVAPSDLVYHLGDVSFHGNERTREILHQLKGNKILIRGNHDKAPKTAQNMGFLASMEAAMIKIGSHDVFLRHEPGRPAPGIWIVHGHTHQSYKIKSIEKKISVCVEMWNYGPVSEGQLCSLMDRAANPWGDHEEESGEEADPSAHLQNRKA